MAEKLMYIPNADTQNYLIFSVKLVVETFEYSTLCMNQSIFTEVPKVVKPTNKEMLL